MGAWSGEAKYRALLRVSEGANAHLDLCALLQAVVAALEGLVPFDNIGVVGDSGGFKSISGHVRSNPRRPGESEDAYRHRLLSDPEVRQLVSREMYQSLDILKHEHAPVVVDDVNEETRVPVKGAAALGAHNMVLLRLEAHTKFVGVLSIARTEPRPFSPDEVRILEDISRPVATAVANSFAYEEIRRLRARAEEENIALRQEVQDVTAIGGIIGGSSALHAVLERVALVAPTDATVLITGETGTGKALIARALHTSSLRAKSALIKVNCAALPESLVCSELFGHERGAFTGALERRRGRFELASGGTIFLDEIGELPPVTQVALLRVLQEGEFERVGGSETLRTDARIVAATNRQLGDAVQSGKFRSDLYFRLNVFPITVPPLRDRTADIPILAEYYASYYARKLGKRIRGIEPNAVDMLTAYPWPGNVRELQNIVERAVILAGGELLSESDLEVPGLASANVPLRDAAECERIEDALRVSGGRVSGPSGAAGVLGVAPSTLESRIQRLGIDKYAFRRRLSNRPVDLTAPQGTLRRS